MMYSDQRRKIKNKLREKQDGKCCYCGISLARSKDTSKKGSRQAPNSETIEHLHRRIDGGRDIPDNLALSCRKCNVGRGDTDWFTYKTYKAGELFA